MTDDSTSDTVVSLDVDQYDARYVCNPVALQELIRESGAVVHIEKYDAYAVGRYNEIRHILSSPADFISGSGSGLSDIRKPGAWREPSPITESDPPAHTKIREVLQKIISPAVVHEWQEMYRRSARKLVSTLLERQTANVASNIAEEFIMDVFPLSLGIEVHRENFVLLGNHRFNALGPQTELFQGTKAKLNSASDWFRAAVQRESMLPGGFGIKLFEFEDAGAIPLGVASKLVMTFLAGGMETTISGIGSSLLHLAQNPTLWNQMRMDRSRRKWIFEEAIRMDTPIQSFYRLVTRPVQISGLSLRPETKIQVFLGAGNRDPRQWKDPNVFDITRSPVGHLAFGHGIHACLGQMIARMEWEALFSELLDRVKAIEPLSQPTYKLVHHLRTLESFTVRVLPA